jgi:hypothetical protein
VSFVRSLASRGETTTDPLVHRSKAVHDEVPIEAIEAPRV